MTELALRRILPGAFAVLTACTGAVAYPLLTYTTSLAAFGLIHVLSEMRYVRARFGARLGSGFLGVVGVCLGGIVALRCGTLTGALPVKWALPLELGLVCVMAIGALPFIWRVSPRGFVINLALTCALLIGLLISPIHTVLLMAVLHNLTPIGFIAELSSPAERWLTVSAAALIFVMVPLLIASGIPYLLLARLGLSAPDMSLLPAGLLFEHFGAYLPRAWHGFAHAQHAFSAIVFAQCMHYFAVIYVLPKALHEHGGEPEGREPRARFWLPALGLAAMLFVFFCMDFSKARSVYGVAAAVHAWIEIPILMISLSALTSKPPAHVHQD